MSTHRIPTTFDHAELRIALAGYAAATHDLDGSSSGPFLISRSHGEPYWTLTIMTAGGPIKACTGTNDRDRARAMARAAQADAAAGCFAFGATASHARALALMDAYRRFKASRRIHRYTSATKAGNGWSKVRKIGSRA